MFLYWKEAQSCYLFVTVETDYFCVLSDTPKKNPDLNNYQFSVKTKHKYTVWLNKKNLDILEVKQNSLEQLFKLNYYKY